MYQPLSCCRLCRGTQLQALLDLGQQYLTGVFPKDRQAPLTCGPLGLGRCADCGLVQLLQTYDLAELYGQHYGYRSGLNQAMVAHLRATAAALQQQVGLRAGDSVLDIGSNDGTFLGSFAPGQYRLLGMDPSAAKFRQYYRPDIALVPEFFSAASYARQHGGTPARLVTSIAMFYDLPDPLAFARDVASILAPDGLWHTEQSYLPAMLAANAYDTVCHEHLEYYALAQLVRVAEQTGLKIVALAANDVNGGSFAVTLAHRAAPYPAATAAVARWLAQERALGLDTERPLSAFQERVVAHRAHVRAELARLHAAGRRVLGYGASTKGNVLLQYCGITPDLLPAIAEVNPDKFGAFTPGTGIPIIPEGEARAQRPDYFLVLPWHFRRTLVQREAAYLQAGGRMIFPLPQWEVVGA